MHYVCNVVRRASGNLEVKEQNTGLSQNSRYVERKRETKAKRKKKIRKQENMLEKYFWGLQFYNFKEFLY